MAFNLVKKSITKIIALTIVIALCIIFLFITTRAENVVKDYPNPDLTFIKLEGTGDLFRWKSDGTFSQNGNIYTLKTNCWANWSPQDSVDFAYKNVQFNYGKDGVMTIETKINSWSAGASTGNCGIMIRETLANNSRAVSFGPRPQGIYQLFRFKEGGEWAKGVSIEGQPNYPMYLKVVLQNSKVTCYYRGEGEDWKKMAATIPFQFSTNSVYVGLYGHSSAKEDLATAIFENFNVLTEGPEGSGGTDSSSSEGPILPPDETFPPDLPVTDNVLLRETFTDNDIFGGTASVTNPIWTSSFLSPPEIVTKEAEGNRYLSSFFTDEGAMIAGNRNWTDYSVSADVMFTNDFLPEEVNTFKLLFRVNDFTMYNYYALVFTNETSGTQKIQKMKLVTVSYAPNMTSTETVLHSIDYNYLSNDANHWHKIRVDVIDNKFTIFIDNVEKIKLTDTTSTYPPTMGRIGFVNAKANFNIDNITVTKLSDPLGGDYDNKIGGNYDKPVPEYLDKYNVY
jgi:hypothetical protein